MTRFSIRQKTVAILLSLLLSTTFMSGCKNKKEAESTVDGTVPASQEIVTESASDIVTTTNSSDATVSSQGTTASKTEGKTTGKTTTKAATPATTVKPAAQASKVDSGLSKSTNVENATDSSQLKDVDPNTAANSSYDTEVSVENTDIENVTTDEYVYVAESDYETHANKVWSAFKTNEKVKLDEATYKQYLNLCCLSVKNNFYEINCTGYDCSYAIDGSGYVYADISWIYYINASQYSACKSKATSIVNSASGTTVEKIRYIHDKICATNTYKENIDGAYNCLVNGKSDCDGYTAAFQICMEILGVPCKAYSTSNHIFNFVKLSGNWYAIDVTWDDQDDVGITFATYFLRGKASYSGHTALTSYLASSDYSCDRIGTIVDEDKVISYFGLDKNDVSNLRMGGPVEISGTTYSDSLIVYSKTYGCDVTYGFSFSNNNA